MASGVLVECLIVVRGVTLNRRVVTVRQQVSHPSGIPHWAMQTQTISAKLAGARTSAAGPDPSIVRLPAALPSLCVCGWRDPGATSMADADDVRDLALALPHVTEIESDGFDFRVADKGFVWSYPERRPGKPRLIRTDIAVLLVGYEAEKQSCPASPRSSSPRPATAVRRCRLPTSR